MRTVLLTLTQALGLLSAGAGFYLLAGLAWLLLVLGVVVLALATLAELAPRTGARAGGRF